MDEDSTPRVLLQTPFDESFGTFSPDGRIDLSERRDGPTLNDIRPQRRRHEIATALGQPLG
jgi:hypothetical protein